MHSLKTFGLVGLVWVPSQGLLAWAGTPVSWLQVGKRGRGQQWVGLGGQGRGGRWITGTAQPPPVHSQ